MKPILRLMSKSHADKMKYEGINQANQQTVNEVCSIGERYVQLGIILTKVQNDTFEWQ